MTTAHSRRQQRKGLAIVAVLALLLVVVGVCVGPKDEPEDDGSYEAVRAYCVERANEISGLVPNSHAWVRYVNDCMVRVSTGDLRE